MPIEAKLGLVMGMGLTLLVALYFKPSEMNKTAVPTASFKSTNTEVKPTVPDPVTPPLSLKID